MQNGRDYNYIRIFNIRIAISFSLHELVGDIKSNIELLMALQSAQH